MKYNSTDNIMYCTNTERTTASATLLADTSKDTMKFYEVDTKDAYIILDGTWYVV